MDGRDHKWGEKNKMGLNEYEDWIDLTEGNVCWSALECGDEYSHS
jgi:hypothetical protein